MSAMAITLSVIFWLWVMFPGEFGRNAAKTINAYRATLQKDQHHGHD